MVAYTKPQHRKKEESERLRGERDQIKFIDLRFEMNTFMVEIFMRSRPLSVTQIRPCVEAGTKTIITVWRGRKRKTTS